jgi:membrane-bound lytic murein transglycosylase D
MAARIPLAPAAVVATGDAGADAGASAPGAVVAPAPSAAPASADAPASAAAIVAGSISGAAEASASTPEESDLWGRIRRGFKMPDLDNKKAQSSTRWYASQPEYIARMSSRASMYLYHIVEEIEKRGMPTELALLPFVESAMQPEAVSWAKAAGLWQFIPSTGRLYSLEQNLWKDERFGVIESTRAALDYLQKLYAEFGDWQLALAAYNCGEAGVERALARARAQHRSVAYQDLRLPAETQYYVPKLQAIKNIVSDPQHYGIALPAIPNQPYFVAFNKTLDMDVSTAARLADMPLDEFRLLNPAFNRPVLVPADRAESFDANLAAWQATGQPLASWTAYTLQPGEALSKVAERVGLTEAQLREANRIPPRYRPVAGSTILVPRDGNVADDIAPGFVTASLALVPEFAGQRQVSYRVRRGDTLATVARRWHVNPDDIVAWNQLRSPTLLAGQRLNLTVGHPASAPAPRKVVHKAAPAGSAGHAGKAAAPSAPSTMAHGAAAPRVATTQATAAVASASPHL